MRRLLRGERHEGTGERPKKCDGGCVRALQSFAFAAMFVRHPLLLAPWLLAVWIGLLLVPCAALAQTTRAEVIAARQAEKADALDEEGPGRAEEVVIRVGEALMGGPPMGLYPWLGSVIDGAGTSIGLGYRRALGGEAAVNTVAAFSVRRSTLLQARVDLPRLAGGRIATAIVARQVHARGMAFYGLGADSRREARGRFDFEPASAGAEVTARPLPPVVLGAGYERLGLETRRDWSAQLPAMDAPGVDESLRYGVTRLTAALDWRPAEGYATSGGFLRGAWVRHNEIDGQPYTFDTRELEASQLVPLVREHYVLAFRGLATFTTARDGSRVPFMLAPYLGSGSTLRGFRNRRFVDDNRLLLTGEYRWRPSRYLDMALFVDAGQVAARHDAFRFDAFATSVGVGGRFHGPTFNALRFDVARGREGWALAVSTAQPF